jgi:hypothetical protein
MPSIRICSKRSDPNTQRAALETIWNPQTALLGDDEDMREIAAAWQKIPALR